MNPENHHIPDDHWDDERLTALFAAADSDSVPPDREFLKRLRDRSTEVFAAAASRQTQPSPRRRNMFALAIRAAAATAAAVTIVGALPLVALRPERGGRGPRQGPGQGCGGPDRRAEGDAGRPDRPGLGE